MNISKEMANTYEASRLNNVFDQKIKNNKPLTAADTLSIDSSINEETNYYTTLASLISKRVNSANAVRAEMAAAKGIKLPSLIDLIA